MLRAFLLSLLIASNAYPFDIGKPNRVANGSPGYCSWACVESLARYHKIPELYTFVKNRPISPGIMGVLVNRISTSGVWCAYQEFGSNQVLTDYANTLGVVVGIKVQLPERMYYHAIVLTRYDRNLIEFYDPNDTEKEYIATRTWFDSVWTGWALVIFPHDKAPKPRLMCNPDAYDPRRYTGYNFLAWK